MYKTSVTLLFTFMGYFSLGQCNSICQDVEFLQGVVTNQSYNGSKCFEGYGVTITNSVNFNNFQNLSFTGTMTIQQTLNVNNNQNLYLQGHITVSTVTLAGNAQLFLTENVNISNIISNNGPTNALYTSSYFNYNGIPYFPGDTIFTGGGTWNYVPVKLCESTPVSIRVKYFRLIPNGLEWEAHNGVPVLQYSVDSRN